MLLIPVLDISQGQVVHARQGKRDNYRPVQSRLATGADPLRIVDAFLSLYPFPIIYIADLDAIEGTGNNNTVIRSLPKHFPAIRFWIDAGVTAEHTLPYTGITGFQSVLGSENGLTLNNTAILLNNQPEPVLSLDFSEDGLIGDQELMQNSDIWPGQIIVMTINRVGSSDGPDLERIQMIQHLAPSKHIFAAGGVRYQQDLDNLSQCGVDGVLIASALHDLTIPNTIITSMMKKKCPDQRGI